MIYVGIDIAKLNHFASAISSDGEELIKPFKFTNDNDGFQLLISKLDPLDKDSLIIGLESTAHYGDNLVRYLVAKNYKVCVLNPIKTSTMRKNNIRKTKTDKVDSFKPYLGTIARNMAKNALRKTSKMHFENYEDAFQVGTNEHIEYGPLKEEVIKCLKESIYELSVDERKCFISYYYYTKTIAVIAEETGLKESTVKSKLLRGRKKLKLKMEKKGFRYEDCKIFFE